MTLLKLFVHPLKYRINAISQNPLLLTRCLSTAGPPHKSLGVASTKAREQEQVLSHRKKVMTIPNILTVSRIILTPAIGYLICTGAYQGALYCFAYAAATDLLDGFIARTFNQQSDLGAILDPIADKALLATSTLAMAYTGLLPVYLVQSYVLRDILILFFGAIARNYSFTKRPTWSMYFDFHNYPALGFEPTLISKCHTAILCAIVIGHLGYAHMLTDPAIDQWLWYAYAISTGFNVISLCQYGLRSMVFGRLGTIVAKPKSKRV